MLSPERSSQPAQWSKKKRSSNYMHLTQSPFFLSNLPMNYFKRRSCGIVLLEGSSLVVGNGPLQKKKKRPTTRYRPIVREDINNGCLSQNGMYQKIQDLIEKYMAADVFACCSLSKIVLRTKEYGLLHQAMRYLYFLSDVNMY